MAEFHGFYYTKKNGAIYGLPFGKTIRQAMSDISKSHFTPLSREIFIEKFSRWLVTHAPQGFIAWNGDTYWVVGNCRNILTVKDEELGVNVIRFNGKEDPRYYWYTKGETAEERQAKSDMIDSDDDDPVYHLVYTPWDWLLSGYGDEDMFPLDHEQLKIIENNNRIN